MIELECPSCGRGGAIPRDKINTRLVCKKCHSVFHISPSGRALLGEPHAEPVKAEAAAERGGTRLLEIEGLDTLADRLSHVRLKSLVIGLAVLVAAGGLWMLLLRPPERLADRTSATVQRFADDDLAYLKEIAADDTADDVVRWFDVVHPEYVKLREEWKNKGTEVRVTVIDEDRRRRTGEAQAFVYPATGPVHAAAIAGELDASPTPVKPMDLTLCWTLDGRGRWRLDGARTFQAASRPH
jgi:hypothetical protein